MTDEAAPPAPAPESSPAAPETQAPAAEAAPSDPPAPQPASE
jgi:hypothetical protein